MNLPATALLGERYDVLAPIGAGSAATVFRVRDRWTGALRAAKVLTPENARVPEILARFEDEYRILRTLHHPHLPEVHDYGWTDDGGRFLVMELVDGVPLDAYFREHPTDIWVILYELCEILVFIHAHDLLHQDIKPSNILVKRTTAFGEERPLVKLIDFGLTYRRDTGAAVKLVGTAAYVAPEVVRGESPLTRAVDYYSLGATLFELLAGHPPFEGSESDVLRAHLERTPRFETERLEWAELYPHVRALLGKQTQLRLAAFEELRRAVVNRLTGGIAELDRAYGSARIESLGMIGKAGVWEELLEATGDQSDKENPVIVIAGHGGSGRRFLLDALRAAWRIRGERSWGLGHDSEAAHLLERPGNASLAAATERDFERAWLTIESTARVTPVWIAVNGTLSADEERLLQYLETRRTLSEAAVRRHVRFAFAIPEAGDLRGSFQQAPVREFVPARLAAADVEGLIDRFRPEMFRTADTQALHDLLGSARGSGEIIPLLRRLTEGGALILEAQRWHIDHDRAQTLAAALGDEGPVSLTLTSDEATVMGCTACHPAPVPVAWLVELTGLEGDQLARVLTSLQYRHLVESAMYGEQEALRIAGRSIESSVYAGMDDAPKRRCHACYAEKMSAMIAGLDPGQATAELQQLAHHQERSGEPREAYRTRRALFREWRSRGAYGDIEMVCRAALATRPELEKSLARAYLRDLIGSLWARNLVVHAFKVMDEYSKRYNGVPNGLLPKYVRGMADVLGPEQALQYAHSVLNRAGAVGKVLVCRLRIEMTLCLYNLNRFPAALRSAHTVGKEAARLSPSELARLWLYESAILTGVGVPEQADIVLERAGAFASEHGLVDEILLGEFIRARVAIDDGRPDLTIRIAGRALRIASKHRMALRQFQLMAHIATAYNSIGDNSRASKWRAKTVRLAGYLGLPGIEVGSWWRLATYEQAVGKLGNALRYFDRAMRMLDSRSRASEIAYANVLNYELHVLIGTEHVPSLARQAARAIENITDIGEQGTIAFFRADALFREGCLGPAKEGFRKSRQMCLKGRRRDDAFRAGVALSRAFLAEGRIADCKRLLDQVEEEERALWYADASARKTLVRLLLCQYERCKNDKVVRTALANCRESARCAHLTTRLEIAVGIFRVCARRGWLDEARDALDEYKTAVRDVVANLESDDLSARFLKSIGFAEIVSEFSTFEKRSAHAGSVSTGAPRGFARKAQSTR